MNRRIVILLWLIPIGLFAQTSEELKLQKLFAQHKYGSCLNKSIQYSKSPKLKNEAFPYLYQALALQQTCYTKSGSIDLEKIKASYNAIRTGKKIDKKKQTFTHENAYYDSLLFYYHHLSQNLILSNHKTEAKSIASKLASDFHDTIEVYYVFFPAPKADKKSESAYVPDAYEGKKLADSLIFLACQYQYKPYQYGADGPESFDCSGFVQFVYAHFGIKLPHNAHMISELGETIPADQMQKGDLVFFGTSRAYHVAISVTGKSDQPKVIHCVSRGVIVDDFGKDSYWGKQAVYKVVRLKKA